MLLHSLPRERIVLAVNLDFWVGAQQVNYKKQNIESPFLDREKERGMSLIHKSTYEDICIKKGG